MVTRRDLDKMLLITIGFVLVLSVGIYLYSTDYFSLRFAAEDGLVEYATAVFLFLASLVLMKRAFVLTGRQQSLLVILTFFYALLFFFAAGEEISWGQRIFGWETGETFQEINKQGETNLHNLIVKTPWGEFHLAKTLFGPFLTLVLLLYLVGLPLVYERSAGVQRLANRFAVPVPGKRHAALALAASIVIAVIDVSRKWEVYELVFSLLAVSIFLLPKNDAEIS